MTFLKLKLVCYCKNAFTPTEMALIEDDMEWVFECPECRKQVSIQNWTSDNDKATKEGKP